MEKIPRTNLKVSKVASKKEISKEKEIRIIEISLTPVFIALFISGFYLLHLKTIGVVVSDWFFLSSIISVIFGSLVVCLAFNELLLKTYGGQFKFKRLLFRWILIGINFSLLMGAYFSLSTLFPKATMFYHFLFSGLIDTIIFVIIIIKFRHLFSRLDNGEW